MELIVVTGSNKGIGLEIVKTLAEGSKSSMPTLSTTIVMCSRSLERGKAAMSKVKVENYDVVLRQLDIDSEESVKAFKSSFPKGTQIQVLINNAAIAFKSSDPTPFDQQARPTITTNFFNTVRLTNALRDMMAKNSKVVNVASQAGSGALSKMSKIRREELLSAESDKRLIELANAFIGDVESKRHAGKVVLSFGFFTLHNNKNTQSFIYSPEKGWTNTCYGTSKAFVIAWTYMMQKQRSKGDPSFASCCPGYCATDMSSHRGPRSAKKGAETPVWLALMTGDLDGGFYFDKKKLM
jgi:NAD(P)-dependent dehydrogenase (short-subunit alcohol dehydrogenase family)